MSERYTRRITLWINGKEVKNDIASITSEMTKLTNQQRRMTIGSKEYIAAGKEINQLKGILAQHRADLNKTSQGWLNLGKAAEGFNRYFGMVTAAIASFTGVALGIKKAIDSFNEFEERVSNLSALTGLAGEELKWLADKADELSTASLESGIRVTQSAKDIVDAFTKTGSARPELLKNKEELARVTQEAIILSNASKTELQPAIEALTMVMNQYNVPASEARRIINSLAAGSKEGAGEIPYLTTAFEKAGTVAADADISIETLVATIETLAPRISQPEIAGRSLKGVILDLQTGADDTNPAIVGLATALENLGKKNLSTTQLTKMFGVENITTAKILIDNVGELKKYEAAVTGTSVAIEQAAVNTNNNSAKLAQAKNAINLVSKELGEKLSPAYSSIIGKTSLLLQTITTLVDFLTKYGKILVVAAVSVATYTVAINAANWATKLYSGLTAIATTVTTAFNTAVKMNPVGLIISLLTTAATAFFLFKNKAAEATVEQRKFNEVIEEGNRLLGQNKTLEERASIAKNLSKQQLEGLQTDLETQLKTEDDFHAKLLANLKTKLDSDEKLRDLNEKRKQKNLTELQKITLNSQAIARQKELAMELQTENNANQKRIQNLKKHLGNVSNELKNRPADIITPTGGGGTGTGTGDAVKKAEQALETAFISEQNMIKQQLLDKKLTQEQFNMEMLALEMAHLVAMRELKKQYGSDVTQIDSQILDQELKAQDFGNKQLEEMMRLASEVEKSIAEADQKTMQDTDKEIADSATDTAKKVEEAGENIIKSIDERIAAAERLRQIQVENAVFEGESAIENAETVEEAGKAILNSIRKQIMAHIAESIAISMAKALKTVPFPFNIIAATAAGGAASFLMNKLIPKFATGNYPDMEFTGSPRTGMYGSRPQLGIFNEVPGQPEMVVDGLTTRKLMINYPEIVKAIYQVRDGRTPQFADGKYPATSYNSPPVGGVAEGRGGVLTPEHIIALTAALQEFTKFKPAVSVELFEKKQMQFQQIKDDNKL